MTPRAEAFLRKWGAETAKRMSVGPYALQRLGRAKPFTTGLSLSMAIAVLREVKRRNPDESYHLFIPPQGIAA